MTTLGQDLKRERELRAVSLKEIANSTKISLRFLEALEADRWDDLAGPFFIKGVIRAYCKTIGADEDYFVNKYHHGVLLHKAAELREERRPRVGAVGFPASFPIRPHPRTVIAGVVILIAAAAVVFLVFIRPRRSPLPVIRKPAGFVAPTIAPPAVPSDLAPAPESPAATLRLELSFREETWMKATADGRLVLDGLKKAGESVSLEAREAFVLHTGNAGGVELKINGRPARPLGIRGEVRTDIRITRENFQTFLQEPAPAAGVLPGG
jgi:hypothetical protein